MPIQIHGNEYFTVAECLKAAHDSKKLLSITTELLPVEGATIVVKATVVTKEGTFTGISAVNPQTALVIEKGSPYEVAETSAVGRALKFAGYGISGSIATADEMVKAGAVHGEGRTVTDATPGRITQGQKALIVRQFGKMGKAVPVGLNDLSFEEARKLLADLM